MGSASSRHHFICPTSGQMLGALVSAFRLHIPSVGGPSAEFLGSGNAGKRSRDYFEGKWVPEVTRDEICAWVVQAIVHSKILPEFLLPTALSGERPETEKSLRIALFTWLQIWDGAYMASAARWPRADLALAGFVMGRQVVIDLALRWGAVCQLCGITAAEAIVLEDGRQGKAKGIIESAFKRAGRQMTREELTKAMRAKRPGKINDRTVDRWFDSLVVPDDVNLVAIANALSATPDAADRLLRFLRLQYGGLLLAMKLRNAIGDHLCDLLLDGLTKFVRCSIRFNQAAQASLRRDAEQLKVFETTIFRLLMMGSGDPVAAGWINAWLSEERSPIWHDDFQYAGDGAVVKRITACMKVIGDLDGSEAALLQRGVVLSSDPAERRQVLECSAIMAMNDTCVPDEMKEWIAANPDRVRKIVGDDEWKAAMHAEHATAAMNEGDREGALLHWARAVALEASPRPKSNYMFFYGCCLWQARSRRYDDAIDALRESFQLWPEEDPQRDRPFVEIAIICQNRGWFENALQHLDTDPADFANTSGHFNFVKGRTLHSLHKFDEALLCFEKAIELNADSTPDAHAFAADCAFELARSTGDRQLSKTGRGHAKQALHLGRSWAHDKWAVG